MEYGTEEYWAEFVDINIGGLDPNFKEAGSWGMIRALLSGRHPDLENAQKAFWAADRFMYPHHYPKRDSDDV